MDTKEGPVYIALGTKRKLEDNDGKPAKAVIGAPWEVYMVACVLPENIGFPPYYRVSGVVNGEPELEKLVAESNHFRKVNKWVGHVELSKDRRTAERMVLNSINPSCVVSKETAMYLVQLTEEYNKIISVPEEDRLVAVLKKYVTLMDD